MRHARPLGALSRRCSRASSHAAAPPIDPQALLEHIKFLASDDLQGRGNGTAGLERAGDYIAEQFKAAGLTPAGSNGDWFQPFELTAGLRIAEGNSLVIHAGGADGAAVARRIVLPAGGHRVGRRALAIRWI